MLDERIAHDAARSGDDVDGAGRQVRLEEELGQAHERQRGHLGRLHDRGVAGREDRGHPLDAGPQRAVPGQDLGDDPHRLEELVVDHRRVRHLRGGAAGQPRPAAEEAQGIEGDREVRVVDGPDRLAGVDALEERQLVGVALDEVGDPEERGRPILGGGAAPGPLVHGRPGGGHGIGDIGHPRLRDLRDRLVVAGADRCEDRPVAGRHEPAPDQERVRLAADERPARIRAGLDVDRHRTALLQLATSSPAISSASSTDLPPWMIAARPRVIPAGSGSRQMLLPIATPAQPARITAS